MPTAVCSAGCRAGGHRARCMAGGSAPGARMPIRMARSSRCMAPCRPWCMPHAHSAASSPWCSLGRGLSHGRLPSTRARRPGCACIAGYRPCGEACHLPLMQAVTAWCPATAAMRQLPLGRAYEALPVAGQGPAPALHRPVLPAAPAAAQAARRPSGLAGACSGGPVGEHGEHWHQKPKYRRLLHMGGTFAHMMPPI